MDDHTRAKQQGSRRRNNDLTGSAPGKRSPALKASGGGKRDTGAAEVAAFLSGEAEIGDVNCSPPAKAAAERGDSGEARRGHSIAEADK